ncbi:MAG: hypothetical protein JXR33_02365 [Coriobacteriia bacterium]|nr:hypothetical protein [Coriobacteriia bacterium]
MDRFDPDIDDLDAARDAVLGSVVRLSADRKRAIRSRVMSTVTRDAMFARARVVFRHAVAAVTVTATLLGGVSYAAARSLPGDPLYSIKRVSEELTLQVLPDGQLQSRFLFTIAVRRANEIARMSTGGADRALMLRALEQFRATTSAAYSGSGSTDETDAAEARLQESVNSAPQPARTQLQKAVEDAGSAGSGHPSVESSPEGEGSGSEASGQEDPSDGSGSGWGEPSVDATGQGGTIRP